MATKLDGRPYKIDVYANPALDAEGILISGFPADYLTGASVTAPVWNLGTTTAAGAAWTVSVDSTSITLTMPQASVALIGEGRYTWTLLVDLASGLMPPIIGGSLIVSRDFKPTTTTVSETFGSDPIGVDITIEQVVAITSAVLDGGGPADDDGDTYDGGTP